MSDYDLLKDDVYTLRTEGTGYRVTKFTKDLNPVGFYHIDMKDDGSIICNCPQSNRGHCRHIDIVDGYNLYPERIDKGWFLCYETGDWFPPVRDAEQPVNAEKPVNPDTERVVSAGDAEQGVQLSRREPHIEPPTAGGAEAEDPSLASAVTPEVEAPPPPSPPSGVMTFSEPLKRRI